MSSTAADREPFWHVQLAALVAAGLYLLLPDKLTYGLKPTVVGLELLLIIGLALTSSERQLFRSRQRRVVAVLLIGAISLTNFASLERLVHYLLAGGVTNGRELIIAAISIYLTNIIIFGMWYWELDGGGPLRRRRESITKVDFLFPQHALQGDESWRPTFADYLYVSATNAMAFSPTDTMPLSVRAKFLMGIQALASIVTIALVAARAVNILN